MAGTPPEVPYNGWLRGRDTSQSSKPIEVGMTSFELAAQQAEVRLHTMMDQVAEKGTCDLAASLDSYIDMRAQIPEEKRRDHPEFVALQTQLRDAVGVFGLGSLVTKYSAPEAVQKRTPPSIQ